MKIAILNCLKANEVCAGCSCLKAFHTRTHAFQRYEGQDIELCAFLRCNGCSSMPESDSGMLEKLDRLKEEGVDAVHLGVCTHLPDGSLCPNIQTIISLLSERGIPVIDGTH